MKQNNVKNLSISSQRIRCLNFRFTKISQHGEFRGTRCYTLTRGKINRVVKVGKREAVIICKAKI